LTTHGIWRACFFNELAPTPAALKAWLEANRAPAVKPVREENDRLLIRFCSATLGHAYHIADEHVDYTTAAGFDLDNGASPAAFLKRCGELKLGAVIYSTHSNTPERPAYRGVIWWAAPCPGAEHKRAWKGLHALVCPDAPTQCCNPSRGHNAPPPDATVHALPGAGADWRSCLEACPTPEPQVAGDAPEARDLYVAHAQALVGAAPPDAPGSTRSGTWLVARDLIRGLGLSQATALPFLRSYNARSSKPFDEEFLVRKLASAETTSEMAWLALVPLQGGGSLNPARTPEEIRATPFTPEAQAAAPIDSQHFERLKALLCEAIESGRRRKNTTIAEQNELIVWQCVVHGMALPQAVDVLERAARRMRLEFSDEEIPDLAALWTMSCQITATCPLGQIVAWMHNTPRGENVENVADFLRGGWGAEIRSIERGDSADLYEFVRGKWRRVCNLKPRLRRKLHNLHLNLDGKLLSAVCDELKSLEGVQAPEGFLARNALIFNNGYVDLNAMAFHPPDSGLFQLGGPDVDHAPDAPCGNWLAFLESALPGRPRAQACLQEAFGYSLSRETRAHKAFLLQGAPRAGKGVTLDVLSSLLGAQCGPFDLKGLPETFGRSALLGRSVATDADVKWHDSDGKAVGYLLKIIADDCIAVPVKYAPDWTGKLGVRLWLASNDLPRYDETSGALLSRLITIVFPDTFLGREDRDLSDRLRAETAGIANWALAGLQRLRAAGWRFTAPEGADELANEVRGNLNPVADFVDDLCVCEPSAEIARDVLYNRYVDWAKMAGLTRVLDRTRFGKALRGAAPGLTDSRPQVEGARKRIWLGVRLR
jgi:P4 family phage/plasmid primase-like protien